MSEPREAEIYVGPEVQGVTISGGTVYGSIVIDVNARVTVESVKVVKS